MHQGNYLWLLVTFRKVPQKKLWPVETQGFWWKCCQVGQISCPENCRKNEKFRKNKNTPANYIIWTNYCNTDWTNIFCTKKMPLDCILWGKFRKSVVFFQKSAHNFFPLCFTDFFPAKHLLTYGWATRGSNTLKPLRPVCDELRDPQPEKHLSYTHFWPFSNYHKSTSGCCRERFFSSLFPPIDVLSACSHLQY